MPPGCGVHDFGATGHGRNRHAAAECLGGGDQVRNDAVVLAGEPFAGAASLLDLVGDVQHVMRVSPFGQSGRKPSAGTDEAAFALNRFGDHGGHGGGADQQLDLGGGGLRGGRTVRTEVVAQRIGERYAEDVEANAPKPCLYGMDLVVMAMVRLVRPWNAFSITTMAERPVYLRAILMAFSTNRRRS